MVIVGCDVQTLEWHTQDDPDCVNNTQKAFKELAGIGSSPPYVHIYKRDTSQLVRQLVYGALPIGRFTLDWNKSVCEKCGLHRESRTSLAKVCHPRLEQKYTDGQKVAGGVGSILTLGIGAIWWPWFTNSEQVCNNSACQKPPGSKGCQEVSGEVQHTLSKQT